MIKVKLRARAQDETGNWLPWHEISAQVYEYRKKWPRKGYEIDIVFEE